MEATLSTQALELTENLDQAAQINLHVTASLPTTVASSTAPPAHP